MLTCIDKMRGQRKLECYTARMGIDNRNGFLKFSLMIVDDRLDLSYSKLILKKLSK